MQSKCYLHAIFAKYLPSNVTFTQRVFSHNLRMTTIIDISLLHHTTFSAKWKKSFRKAEIPIKGYLTSWCLHWPTDAPHQWWVQSDYINKKQPHLQVIFSPSTSQLHHNIIITTSSSSFLSSSSSRLVDVSKTVLPRGCFMKNHHLLYWSAFSCTSITQKYKDTKEQRYRNTSWVYNTQQINTT